MKALMLIAISSAGLYAVSVSASVGADARAMRAAMAGEAARRKPADVKNMESAESLRIRRRGEFGGTDAEDALTKVECPVLGPELTAC